MRKWSTDFRSGNHLAKPVCLEDYYYVMSVEQEEQDARKSEVGKQNNARTIHFVFKNNVGNVQLELDSRNRVEDYSRNHKGT